MGLNLVSYEDKAREAIKLFWGNRHAAVAKQKLAGKVDAGERAGVTAGKNMDGFFALIVDLVEKNGLKDAEIHLMRRVLTLPGYFRPTKLWDILIISKGHLVAALEFKSQVGPSFGNNFNNRAEESIGTAVDLWTAYRESAFGEDVPRPFVGWLMLLEDCAESRIAVRDKSPHFPVLKDLQCASYAERYNNLCRKLMLERLYSAATIIVSPRDAHDTGAYSELSDTTSLNNFVASFAGHIAAEAARK
ncbi:PaeR7I family type II restriction endonuclease [Mesorhizobium onobrychidis]|uniref:Type-2 restriction enzyme n=1 Tax=Mesorhizobium onobrychidis TaxID=2775404 RepID=A0ABY5QW14_9HYPH|nr:PaeR7I family type II restriction endonuclease [Mesorhizobium onobrychidis]UVC15293.1 restriction endonuclease [Mesorhizobium onobrychidis]